MARGWKRIFRPPSRSSLRLNLSRVVKRAQKKAPAARTEAKDDDFWARRNEA